MLCYQYWFHGCGTLAPARANSISDSILSYETVQRRILMKSVELKEAVHDYFSNEAEGVGSRGLIYINRSKGLFNNFLLCILFHRNSDLDLV